MRKSQVLHTDTLLIIENNKGANTISYNSITHIIYDTPYIIVFTSGIRRTILFLSLTEVYDKLPYYFFKCNKSTIINLNYATALIGSSQRGGILYLNNSNNFSVSVRKYSPLKKILLDLKNGNSNIE